MMGGGPPPRLGTDGDWVCPKEGCGNINFARRMECNRCFTPRVDAPKKPFGDRQFGGEKKTGLFGPSDWACGKCGNMNWERRNECNICNAPKASLGPDEKRDGAGGGFNERQERVASGRREVAEDGYDDFGQRRQKAPVSQADREAAALARLKASYSAMYTNEPISHSVGGDDEDFARKPPTSSRRSPDRPSTRHRSPEASRRRSPEPIRRRSPEPSRRRSPETRRRSPDRRGRSPERRVSRSRDRFDKASSKPSSSRRSSRSRSRDRRR